MPPTPRAARSLRWLVWPAAALVTLGLVSHSSYSAFSSKVTNGGNKLAAGTVSLADDDAGAAALSLTNLKPGASGSRCIAVTSTGTLASSVKLYAAEVAVTKGLGSYVTWTVTQGTGGSFGSCTGFTALASGSSVYTGTLAAFTTAASSFGTGVGTWAPSGASTETRSYQLAYAVSPNAPDSVQGGTAAFDLVWEAQNT
ncbi:Camelysin metallo-endopeptidase [Friedmanniella luteola]|uniref:Camelysin metallo-endopeptidase n=1 Tax=Friedmanniella luteola TaxID=546871 RepID=A0A1H1TJQ9_9ACTN|nr:TasA family protein [Friedmanniella luteola]SDS60206.1 Camelysin metallo-endopeptidase [Friedmanniella luteola]